MKKFLLAASATLALALTAAIPAATPAAAASANDLCNQFNDFGFPTHGQCLHAINKGAIVDACKSFRDTFPAFYESVYGSMALGACVSDTRHLLKSL